MGVYSLSILILFFPPFLYFLQSDHLHPMLSVSFHPPIPWMEDYYAHFTDEETEHSYWELELRFATRGPLPPKPFASSPPYITSPPHLFSSFLASTPGAIAQTSTSLRGRHKHFIAESEGQQRCPCPLFLIKEVIKVNEIKEYGRSETV